MPLPILAMQPSLGEAVFSSTPKIDKTAQETFYLSDIDRDDLDSLESWSPRVAPPEEHSDLHAVIIVQEPGDGFIN
jgi:hypothetical protein